MLISSQLLQTALNNYNKTHPNKENYKEDYSFAYAVGAGTQAAFVNFAIVVAIVFFILELILLFFAIKMVLDCTEPGPERIVHMVLAVMFTLPYVLLNTIFNDCSKKSLKSKV